MWDETWDSCIAILQRASSSRPMSKIECDPTSPILGDDVTEAPIGE